MRARVEREQHLLDTLRTRPVLADPVTIVETREREVADALARTRRCLTSRLDRAGDDLAHTLARVRALSPLATLERGYAVVQRADGGAVVRSPADVAAGDPLRLRLAGGDVTATAGPVA